MSLPRAPLLRRVSLVSLAVAAMAGSAAPALAEDAAAPDADTANTIVVTGDLAAQRKALTEKREALNAVETLQANDVGKLPDQNRLAVTGDASGLMCTATTLVRHREEDDKTRSATLGGEFDDVAGGKLELSGGWTRVTKEDPVRSEFTFTGAKGKTAIDYDGSTDPYTMVAGDAALFARPSSFAFSKYNFEQRHAYEQLWQGGIDYTHPIAIGDGSTFAIGAKYIACHKAEDHDKVDYKAGSTKWTLDQGATTMGDDSFYGGMFDFGTRIDYAAARAYLAANPAVEKEDTAGTLSDSLASDYDVREKIAAGYVMATLKFEGPVLVPGVRIEHTVDDTGAKSVNANSPLDEGYNLFGRPNYPDLAPYVVAEEDDVYNITMGNLDLKVLKAVSYDASLEYYPQVGAAFSAGAFHKSIDDPIYTYRQAPGLWKNYGELLFDRITGGS